MKVIASLLCLVISVQSVKPCLGKEYLAPRQASLGHEGFTTILPKEHPFSGTQVFGGTQEEHQKLLQIINEVSQMIPREHARLIRNFVIVGDDHRLWSKTKDGDRIKEWGIALPRMGNIFLEASLINRYVVLHEIGHVVYYQEKAREIWQTTVPKIFADRLRSWFPKSAAVLFPLVTFAVIFGFPILTPMIIAVNFALFKRIALRAPDEEQVFRLRTEYLLILLFAGFSSAISLFSLPAWVLFMPGLFLLKDWIFSVKELIKSAKRPVLMTHQGIIASAVLGDIIGRYALHKNKIVTVVICVLILIISSKVGRVLGKRAFNRTFAWIFKSIPQVISHLKNVSVANFLGQYFFFVTPRAAENSHEDFAETYAVFYDSPNTLMTIGRGSLVIAAKLHAMKLIASQHLDSAL